MVSIDSQIESYNFFSDECISHIYVAAFTSNRQYAGSDGNFDLEIKVKGVVYTAAFEDLAGDDHQPLKGDLWTFTMSSFYNIPPCVTKSSIGEIAIEEHTDDGWNIKSVITFFRSGSAYELATVDMDAYQWVDGDDHPSHRRFVLTKIF